MALKYTLLDGLHPELKEGKRILANLDDEDVPEFFNPIRA